METQEKPVRSRLKRGCLAAAITVVVLIGGLYGFLTGPRDESLYPAPAESPYVLPWERGSTWLCVQGNRGVVSHRGRGEFSYDFSMPVGTTVCSAREGKVVTVVVEHEKRGRDQPNNKIVIDHGDGTKGVYLHLRKGGSLVEEGQQVVQGQAIGQSGNVGRSLTPHLHFHVSGPGGTIPVTFADVKRQRGIPRMFFRYEAGGPVR